MWPRLLQRVSRAAAFNLGSEDLEITHFITSSSCVARKDSFSSSRAKTPCQEGAFAERSGENEDLAKVPSQGVDWVTGEMWVKGGFYDSMGV